MAMYGNFGGFTGYAPATSKGQQEFMQGMATTEDTLARSEAARIQRMRQEEYLQKQRALAQQQIADLQPAQARQMATPIEPEFDDFSTGGAFTTPTPAPDTSPRTVPERNFAARNETPAGPDQSAAESARLSGKPTPGESAAAALGLKDRSRELQRLKELQKLNPTGPSTSAKARPAVGELQSPAETQRLIEKNRSIAQGATQAEARGAAAAPDFDKLANAVMMVESGGRADAVSPKGAVGKMQTMPGTLADPGYGVKPAKDNSPAEQERVGREYLQAMLRKYGNLEHALMAYNWGPGNVDKWLASGANPNAVPQETRDYVPKVMAQMGGSPMVQTSAPAQAAPAQAATAQAAPAQSAPAQAAPAQVALPAAGQPATPQQAAVMFSPEYVNGTQQQAGEEIRMARMQLAEINQLLAAAPDNATASTLLAAAQKIRFGAQNSLYKDAAARAARGDENAVAQLAGAAAIQYAQTPQGYVAVAQDQNGNWVATSQPMARETFINNLYSVATGAAAARAAKQADQDIKTNADMRVAQQKFGQDLMMERLKSQNALEKLVVEKRLTPVDSKITISSFDGKAYVTNRDGVFVVEPGKDIGNGIKSEPSLVPISPANMPAY